MIIGCAVGSLYEMGVNEWIRSSDSPNTSELTVIVGAGAMLASYTHLSYSLLVIMLETTSSIDLFIPQMVAIIVARGVCKLFTRGLYDRALRTKQIPMLRSACPEQTESLPVKDFMVSLVTTIPSVTDMDSIRTCFATTHEAWPVMNTAGNMIGLISKSILVKLIAHKAFYDKKSIGSMKKVERIVRNHDSASYVNKIHSSDSDKETLIHQSHFSLNREEDHHVRPVPDDMRDSMLTMDAHFREDYDEKEGLPETP